MEDTKPQKLCLVPPHLDVSLFSRSLSGSFYSLLPISFFLLSGAPSSQVLSLPLTLSSHLSISDSVYLATLSFWFFSLSSLLFPGCCSFSRGWLTPAAPALQKFSTLSIATCSKLGFQLLPVLLTVPRWFLMITNYDRWCKMQSK